MRGTMMERNEASIDVIDALLLLANPCIEIANRRTITSTNNFL